MLTSALRHLAHTPLIATVLLALTACGGGSSGGGPSGPEPTPPDTDPTLFTFEAAENVDLGARVESESVKIEGIDVPVPITVEGGEYALNGEGEDDFSSDEGELKKGDTLVLRGTAPDKLGATQTVTVTVGGYTTTFDVVAMTDSEAPQAAFAFPPPMTATDAETLTLRGTATDELSSVESVTLTVDHEGGADVYNVESDTDFSTWAVEVTLAPGKNAVTLATEDSSGNSAAEVATLEVHRQAFDASFPDNDVPFDDISDMTLDHRNGKILVSGWESVSASEKIGEIIAVDLETAKRSTFSGRGAPNEDNPLELIFGIEMDYKRNQVLLGVGITEDDSQVLGVDLDDGSRSVILGPSEAEQSPHRRVSGITMDPFDEDFAYLVAESTAKTLRLDLSEDRPEEVEVVSGSDPGEGSGEPFGSIKATAVAQDSDYIYVVDNTRWPLHKVEVTSGDRELVNVDDYPATRQGEPFATDILTNRDRELLYIFDRYEGVIAFEPETSDWRSVKKFDLDTRFDRSIPARMYLVEDQQYLLFVDEDTQGLYALDLETKEYVIVSKSVTEND